MGQLDREEEQLRSVALQNANAIRLARQRAEDELVRAKEALRESRERLQAALSAAGTGTFRWNIQSGAVDCDDNLNRLFGMPPGETVSSHDAFVALVHPEDRPGFVERAQRCMREGADFDHEFRIACRDGSVRWIEDKAQTFFDEQGRPLYMTGACIDITKRRQADEALRASEQFNRSIIESSRDTFMTLTLEGTLLWMSDIGWRVLGEEVAQKLIGASWIDVWLAEDRVPAAAAVQTASQGGEGKFVGRYDVAGEQRWWNVALSPIPDAAGKPERLLAVARDITERVLLLESERAARATAERANHMKDDFLATLSHELRTPLGAILGWSQILRRGGRGEADLQKGLDTIERNARAQTRLIEDLLDLSRITSGKVRLDAQPLEPAAFVEAALETVKPAADAKGVRLESVLDRDAGPISGDPHRMQQVVWNLLSNAIKFTPKGGKVHVTLGRVNSHVEIAVSDTGQGIEPEFLTHVFERFRQADASTTRRYAGLGLGLAIVKHLVELHGGTVWADSEGHGRGATFTVRLPLMAVQRKAREEAWVHPKTDKGIPVDFMAMDLSGVKVLVVEDEDDSRELIRRVLEDCHARVFPAASAAEALRLIEIERPDVLVSDIGMPGVDGYELLRQVRARGESGGRIPAIALTAFARSEDRTRALRAGFMVHCAKPIEPSELVAAVASAVGRTGG